MTDIIMALAIAILTAAIVILTKKTTDIEKELDILATDEPSDLKLDSLETQVAKANDEIDAIIVRLEEIAEDIGRLDAEAKEDRRNLVDVRRRYILWREPVDKGSGVPWASEYKCNEEEEHE